MALQDQTLNISFNKGLSTKTDSKQVMPGELLILQNAVFTKVQEILKRSGYVPLSSAIFPPNLNTTIPVGVSMGVFNNNDLIVFDGDQAYSYAPSRNSFASQGLKSQLNVSENSLLSFSALGQAGTFIAAPATITDSNGIELLTYLANGVTNNQVDYVYFDTANKTQILTGVSFQSIANTTYTSNELFSFTSSTGQQYLSINQIENRISATANVYGSPKGNALTLPPTPTLLANVKYTLGVSSQNIPVTVSSVTHTNVFILYIDPSYNVTVRKFDNTLTSVGSVVVAPTLTDTQYLMIKYDDINNNIIVGYSNGTDPNIISYLVVYDTNLNKLVGPSMVSSALGNAHNLSVAISGTTLGLFVENQPGALTDVKSIQASIITNYFTTPVVFRTSTLGQNTVISSTAFSQNGYFYQPVVFPGYVTANGNIGQTYFILEYSTLGVDSIPGKYSYETALTAAPFISQTVKSPSGAYTIPFYRAVNTAVSGGVVTGLYNLEEASITFDHKFQTIPLALNLNISGPVPTLYDGKGIAEAGYNVPGYIIQTFQATGVITPGTRAYYATYEWTDLQGNIHRSAPSIGTNVTNASNATITILVPYLGLSEPYKRASVKIVIYRTQNGGTIPYRIASVDNFLGSVSGTVSVVDTAPDSSIPGNQQLYTTGGEVDNTAPAGFRSFTSFKNRIIGVDIEDPLLWWYSKQVIEGFPVEFSDLFTQAIDQRGGPITAVATMDDKLVFFKEYNIFYVTGDGPAPSGANNDFSYPQIITTDSVGCIDPKSIVLTPNGLIFKSHKGIYLLDRGLGCSYIGQNVEQFNNLSITSSCVVPTTTQARFTLSSGSILVYDYFVGQWSEFTNLLSVDSLVYRNQYTLLSPTGVITQETEGVYTDSGAPIPLVIKTGWFSFGNLQGFQRIKEFLILGESESNTSLTIQLSHNFLPAVDQTDVIPITPNARLQYRIFPQRQKCESMQITISDSPLSPFGEGLRLSALGFNIGIKKGLNKVPASQNYG